MRVSSCLSGCSSVVRGLVVACPGVAQWSEHLQLKPGFDPQRQLTLNYITFLLYHFKDTKKWILHCSWKLSECSCVPSCTGTPETYGSFLVWDSIMPRIKPTYDDNRKQQEPYRWEGAWNSCCCFFVVVFFVSVCMLSQFFVHMSESISHWIL